MLSPDEFVARWQDNELARLDPDLALKWGSDDLILFDPDPVEQLTIPESAKLFLIQAGLPRKAYRGLSFAIGTSSLLSISELLPDREAQAEYQRYRVIGIEYFDAPSDWTSKRVVYGFVCLDEQENGRVVSIKNSRELFIEFLNSSVQQLAEFLLILRSDVEQAILNKPISNEEREAHGQVFAQRLREADMEATLYGTGWHSTIRDLEWGR